LAGTDQPFLVAKRESRIRPTCKAVHAFSTGHGEGLAGRAHWLGLSGGGGLGTNKQLFADQENVADARLGAKFLLIIARREVESISIQSFGVVGTVQAKVILLAIEV